MAPLLLEDGGELLLENGEWLLLEDNEAPPPEPELAFLGGLAFWRPPYERLEIALRGDLLVTPATCSGRLHNLLPVSVSGALAAAAATCAGRLSQVVPIRLRGALVAARATLRAKLRRTTGRTTRELLELLLR